MPFLASIQGMQAANKPQTGQTPRMPAMTLQQQMLLQNQYQMGVSDRF